MNRSAFVLKAITLILVIAATLSFASCDKLPFDIGGIFGSDNQDDGSNATPECPHYNVLDSKCFDCGKIFYSTLEELSLGETVSTTQLYYVKVSVKTLLNDTTGEMIVEDETGEMKIAALLTEDGTAYSQMTDKPDECDKMTVQCLLENKGGVWQIKTAFLIEFEAVEAPIRILTVAEALELCGEEGNLTTERYYVRGTVKTVTNPAYGAMVIYDETGEISVYNTSSSDGSVGYADMTERPVKGDQVLLYCTLQNFNGDKEIKSAYLIEFTKVEIEFNEADYSSATIAEAREATEGSKLIVEGVVAQITYANGFKPSGVILVDGTSSIYVYDGDLAGQTLIGDKVKIAAEKTYWILDSEVNNAEKFGYGGACQLEGAILLNKDEDADFDYGWITETTVKEILDTPVSENITTKIFKVNALVNKVDGSGFINYYFNDIDGFTGSYTYTQCSGGDFGWLDEFDGRICTVYLTAINAKSTTSGCVWRFLPIEVIDEGYVFDTDKAAEYAVKYHGITQFLNEYSGDPQAELPAQISSDLLGFAGATLSYSSSDEKVVYFTTDTPGVVTFHCGEAGSATVTVTGEYNGKSYSEDIVITVIKNDEIDHIGVKDAIDAENGSAVSVKGIVGPSLVNQTGFYLIDESGSIPVRVSADVMATLEIGYEVIVSGTRTITKDGDGQICIDSATIAANNYGSHDYSTDSFITGKTILEICNIADSAEATTGVYVTKVKLYVNVTVYSTTVQLQDPDGSTTYLLLYSGGKDQYKWLQAYNEQTVTVEVALCDWNAKGLKGCVLAIVNEDGSKILNTLNFD